jgi:hypothetical protein
MLDIDRLLILRKRLLDSNTHNLSGLPPTVARDPRRKMAWIKARAQQTRDRFLRQYSNDEKSDQQTEFAMGLNEIEPTATGPKRQRSAFVKDEELRCMLEDRIGTPHISELWYDDNMAIHLGIEELVLAGETNVLVVEEDQVEEVEPSDHTIHL